MKPERKKFTKDTVTLYFYEGSVYETVVVLTRATLEAWLRRMERVGRL